MTPFRGLESYRYVDRHIFAGREDQLESLWLLVRQQRACLLYGETGAGKSSLINAGLLPKLIALKISAGRVRFKPVPGAELEVEGLETGEAAGGLPPSLRPEPGKTSRALSVGEFERLEVNLPPTLLIFDQFEEFYTLPRDAKPEDSAAAKQAQNNLFTMLLKLYRADATRARFLFSFREDFLARLDFFLDRFPDLQDNSLRIKPPEREHIREIVSKPFEDGRTYELPSFTPELQESIVRLFEEYGGDRLNLSEVQMACLHLYLHPEDRPSLLHELGVRGLIRQYLLSRLESLDKADQPLAAALLASLLTKDGTRGFETLGSLMESRYVKRYKGVDEKRVKAILAALGEKKLIQVEERRGQQRYEIVSEYLEDWITRQRTRLETELRSRRRMRVGATVLAGLVPLFIILALLFFRRHSGSLHTEQIHAQDSSSASVKSNAIQAAIANCSTSLDSETIESVQQTVKQLEKRAASAPVSLSAAEPLPPQATTCATNDELAAMKTERDGAQADALKSKAALDGAWQEVQRLNGLITTAQIQLESQRTKYHLPSLKPDTPLKRIFVLMDSTAPMNTGQDATAQRINEYPGPTGNAINLITFTAPDSWFYIDRLPRSSYTPKALVAGAAGPAGDAPKPPQAILPLDAASAGDIYVLLSYKGATPQLTQLKSKTDWVARAAKAKPMHDRYNNPYCTSPGNLAGALEATDRPLVGNTVADSPTCF